MYSYEEADDNVTVGYSVAITDIPGSEASTAIKAVGFAGEGEAISKAAEVTRTVKQVANAAGYSFNEETGAMAESDCILEGDILGESASFTYTPVGFMDRWKTVASFVIDKSKLSSNTPINLTWKAVDKNGNDIKDTFLFNMSIKNGEEYKQDGSNVIKDIYEQTGGEANISLTQEQIAKIDANSKVYFIIATSKAGFDGTFELTSITVGGQSLVTDLPDSFTFKEVGVDRWGRTAIAYLPSDFDYRKYKECKIEYTSNDPNAFNKFQAIVGYDKVSDAQYEVNGADGKSFVVTLKNVLAGQGTNPYVKIQTGEAGFSGSITIKKITFIRK